MLLFMVYFKFGISFNLKDIFVRNIEQSDFKN